MKRSEAKLSEAKGKTKGGEGKGREAKGREAKGSEGKGREGKGSFYVSSDNSKRRRSFFFSPLLFSRRRSVDTGVVHSHPPSHYISKFAPGQSSILCRRCWVTCSQNAGRSCEETMSNYVTRHSSDIKRCKRISPRLTPHQNGMSKVAYHRMFFFFWLDADVVKGAKYDMGNPTNDSRSVTSRRTKECNQIFFASAVRQNGSASSSMRFCFASWRGHE